MNKQGKFTNLIKAESFRPVNFKTILKLEGSRDHSKYKKIILNYKRVKVLLINNKFLK